MFLVMRIANQSPVRLTVLPQDDAWAMRDGETGLVLPANQLVGSLIADKISGMTVEQDCALQLSVGAQSQQCLIVRDTPAVDGFTVFDEEDRGFSLSELTVEMLLNTAQAEAISAWLDLSSRRASRVA